MTDLRDSPAPPIQSIPKNSSRSQVASTASRSTVRSRWAKSAVRSFNSFMWWALSLGLFIGIWELITVLGWTNTLILPPPHEFFAEIGNQEQFLAPRIGVERTGGNFVLLTAIVATLKRIVIGLVLGFAGALGIGGLACYFELFGKLTLPVITLLAPIAPIAWIPFAIMAFGIGDNAAIFVVFIGIFFLLTLATVNAIRNVNQLYINTARVLGASRRQVMFKVILPAIVPDLFFILRINFFAAWMAVLAAEMVGVNTGLGAIVMVGRQMFNAKLMFLGMAVIGLVGYLLDTIFRQIQKRVLWWKGASQL